MKKIIFLLLVAFFGMFGASAQAPVIYTKMTAAGYEFKHLKIDSGVIVPVRDTLVYRNANQPGIIVYKPGSGFFGYNGANWSQLAGGGGGGADSAVFFTKYRSDTMRANIYSTINNISANTDSAVFFTVYRADTMRANLYLAIPDSTEFFTVYRADTMRANLYNAIPDSTEFFTVYRADTMRANLYNAIPDTSSLSNRIDQKLNIADTANKWVTNVTTLTDSSFNVSRAGTVSTITIKAAGQATNARRLVTQVYNNTGTTIAKGSVVYINGRHSSNLPTIALAQANDEANSYKTFALVENDIPTSNSGTVIQAGNIGNLNLPTSTYTDGDILYLSPTVAGGYTITKPLAPDHICKLGSVTRAHPTFGSIEIKIENGWELAEMSDVQLTTVPADSALLQFSRVDSLWHDRTITQAIGPYLNAKQDASTAWKTVGNTVGVSDFIGSNNNAPLRFKTNGENAMVLDSIGRLQINGLVSNNTYQNALQLANKNGRNIFSISTNNVATHLSIKANNNAVLDSFVIADSGLIQSRSNSPIWLKGQTTGAGNVNVNAWRSSLAGTGSIFSANVGSNAPIFNMLSTGQMSVGAETPASTAALDITATSRGLLIPRMSTSTRNAIGSPAQGLMIWNTTDTTLNQFTGNTWRGMVGTNPNGTINYTAPSVTGTTVTPILDIAQTWNNASLSNTGFRMNVTNSASQNTSLLMDLQQNASSVFSVNPSMTSTSKVNISRAGGGAGFVLSNPSVANQTFTVAVASNSAFFAMGSGITGAPNFYIGNQGGFAAMGMTNGGDRNVRTVFGNNGSDVSGFYSTLLSSGNFDPGVGGSIFGGTTQYVSYHANPTINQATGTSITRGLYVNPTLTNAADFRAIEATNGSVVLPYTTAAATYAIKTSDYLLNFTTGTFTATLPTAVGCTGKNYVLKNSGTGTVTIATTSSQTIDGAATYSLNAQYKYVHIVSNGANWIVIANN